MLQTFKNWLPGKPGLERADLVLFWLAWLLHVPLLFFLPISIADGNLRTIIGNAGSLALSFVPRWMESRSRYRFPALGEFCLSLIMIVEMFGRTFHLYEEGRALPYDDFSHAVEIGAVSAFAVLLLYAFFLEKKVDYDGWFMLAAGVIIGLGFGALWEIYEWSVDTLFQTNFQYGNQDTMVDLFTGAIGAFVGGLAARYYRVTRTAEDVMEEIPIFYDWL